jgi:hypothetical protein
MEPVSNQNAASLQEKCQLRQSRVWRKNLTAASPRFLQNRKT